jgi:hypothetical protein
MSSRPVLILAEQCLEGAMFGGVVGGSVLPAVPDDVEPGAGEDADRVGVVVAAGDRVAELFVCGPTESDVFDFTGLASGGGDSGQACQRFRGGEPGAAVPNLGEQTGRAGARARQRGEDLRVRVAGELFGDIGVESLDLGVNATSGASATHPRSPTKGWCTSERG